VKPFTAQHGLKVHDPPTASDQAHLTRGPALAQFGSRVTFQKLQTLVDFEKNNPRAGIREQEELSLWGDLHSDTRHGDRCFLAEAEARDLLPAVMWQQTILRALPEM